MTKWIPISAAAVLARRKPPTVYRWIDKGLLSVKDDHETGLMVVSAVEVLEVMATRQTGRPRKVRKP